MYRKSVWHITRIQPAFIVFISIRTILYALQWLVCRFLLNGTFTVNIFDLFHIETIMLILIKALDAWIKYWKISNRDSRTYNSQMIQYKFCP